MVFVQLLVHSSQNPENFLSVESDRGTFCYVNEVTFGGHLKMGMVINGAKQVIRGLEISVPLPILKVGERGRGLNQSPMANVLVNHDTVEKPL